MAAHRMIFLAFVGVSMLQTVTAQTEIIRNLTAETFPSDSSLTTTTTPPPTTTSNSNSTNTGSSSSSSSSSSGSGNDGSTVVWSAISSDTVDPSLNLDIGGGAGSSSQPDANSPDSLGGGTQTMEDAPPTEPPPTAPTTTTTTEAAPTTTTTSIPKVTTTAAISTTTTVKVPMTVPTIKTTLRTTTTKQPPPPPPRTTTPMTTPAQNTGTGTGTGSGSGTGSGTQTGSGSQTGSSTSGGTIDTSNSLRAEVMDTVMAIFNASGHQVDVNGPQFQGMVDILMNGSMPTDQDLINLGIPILDIGTTTTAAPIINPNPPTIPLDPTAPTGMTGGQTLPGTNTMTDTGMTGGQTLPGTNTMTNTGQTYPTTDFNTGTSTGTGTGTNTGIIDPNLSGIPTFPSQPLPGTFPTNTGGLPTGTGITGGTTGGITGGTTGGMTGGMTGGTTGGTTGGLGGLFPDLINNPLTPPGPNSIGGGPIPDPLGGGALPPINPFDPNAIGTKPFPTDMGNMGTPIFGGNTGMGMPTTGILDAPVQKPQGGNNFMSNPMIWMMMMPEMMEGMFGGENSFLTMMLMQKMFKPRRRPAPKPSMPNAGRLMDMVNQFPAGGMPPPGMGMDPMGTAGAGPMGGAPPMSPTGPSSMNELLSLMSSGTNQAGLPPMPGQSSTDLLNSMNGMTGTDPLAPAPNTGLPPPTGSNPFDAFTGLPPPPQGTNQFDMFTGTQSGAGAPTTGGANDINALINMISTGGSSPTGQASGTSDPFFTGTG